MHLIALLALVTSERLDVGTLTGLQEGAVQQLATHTIVFAPKQNRLKRCVHELSDGKTLAQHTHIKHTHTHTHAHASTHAHQRETTSMGKESALKVRGVSPPIAKTKQKTTTKKKR
jgi:hypothetical protein